MKSALITGITGQDGSYLAELLLSKGYNVHGLIRRTSMPNLSRLKHIISDIQLHGADITDLSSILHVIRSINPTEVYNLAAQSYVHESWNSPIATGNITAMGVTNILEAIKQTDRSIRFYQASSSEMFGKVHETPQTEKTIFHPRSPYGVAKLYGHWITLNYRESYDMFCVSGILFNHESPRRGIEFVTRKITDGVARIHAGKINEIHLGNLNAKRDWGHAKDYVNAMWLMLQQDTPDDYVIGTGCAHSVEEFARIAFARVGLDYKDHIKTDPNLYRPAEVDLLLADPTKARNMLNWTPKFSFSQLIGEMVDNDIGLVY